MAAIVKAVGGLQIVTVDANSWAKIRGFLT